MKTASVILAIASAATAIPALDSRQAPSATSTPVIPIPVNIPAAVHSTVVSPPPTSSNPAIIQPITSVYNGTNSRVAYNLNYGLISRTPGVNGDISTLFTFPIPSQYSANTCKMTFSTTQPGSSVSGTGQAQVFTSTQAAAPGSASNFRNQQIGTLQAVQGGLGGFTSLSGFGSGQALSFPCSQLIAQPNFELAPVGETDHVTWTKGDGLLVTVVLQ